MSTDIQILANRRNSQKSTGPRSEAGKLTSSQNACITGIYSEAEIIRDESREDLDALASHYHSHYQPLGPVEGALVDILIHSEWMLRRFRRAEAQLWELNADALPDQYPSGDEMKLAQAIDIDDSRVFSRLQRRIDSTQRNYQRAFKDLTQLQAARPVPKIEPASETAPIGFVPSSALDAQPTPAAIDIHRLPSAAPIGFVPSPNPSHRAAPTPAHPVILEKQCDRSSFLPSPPPSSPKTSNLDSSPDSPTA